MIKKILLSKWFRGVISVVLIYLAFKRVDVGSLVSELKGVPIKWVIFNIIYGFILVLIGSFRWSLLLFGKSSFKKVLDFYKASLSGGFYALFFPTGVAGDLLKWLPLQKKYPEITKFKLFSSVFLDRLVGLTAFMFLAFISSGIGIVLNYNFPRYLFWLFALMSFGVIVFYIIVLKFDYEKFLKKFKRFNLVDKLVEAMDLLKHNDKKVLLKCIFISFFSEFAWIMQVWLVSNIFGAGFTILSVFILLPVIALIMLLPISIAGFGAREQLYLFFFSQVVNTGDTKILLVSTFMGVIAVLSSLLGGLATVF